MKKLAKAGVDEIAVFIYSPIPGSYFADKIGGFKHYSELSMSPTWRKDYKKINNFRLKMYATFFFFKLFYHPTKFFRNIYAVFSRNFNTKWKWQYINILN